MKTRNPQIPVPGQRWRMAALAILTVCAGALFLVTKLDLEQVVRDGINHEVGRLAGENLTLQDDMHVSVRPDLRVIVTDPIFASTEHGDTQGFLTSPRIDATLRKMPLLAGRAEVASLHLYHPHISLSHNTASILFGANMPGTDDSASGHLKVPANIVITEGHLDFDGQAGVSDLNLSILHEKGASGISVSSDFILGSRRTIVDLQVDDPRRFFSDQGSDGRVSIGLDTVEPSFDASSPEVGAEGGLLADLQQVLSGIGAFGQGPLVIDGHFAVTPGAIRISDATFTKSGIVLQGNLDLRAAQDMAIFPQLQTLQLATDAAISDAIQKVGAGDWSATSVGTQWMDGFEIDFNLEGQDIAFGGAALDKVAASLIAHGDGMSLEMSVQSETLGRFEATTAISDAGNMTLSARIENASVTEIMEPISRRMQARLIGTPQLPEGALNADLQLTGRGQTLGEIMDSLAGSVTASMEDGSLTGADVTATLETLAQGRQFMTKEKGPLIPAAGRTEFDLIDGQVCIEAGTARISRLSIAGDRLEIDMLGEVGLTNGTVFVSGNAQLSAAQDAETEQVARHVDLPFGIGGTVFSPMVAAGVPQFEIVTTGAAATPTRAGDTIFK